MAVKSNDRSHKNQPCLCLCLGSTLQITLTTPFRRTTLQLRHIFLTDARTFTAWFSYLRPIFFKLAFFISESYC